MSAQDDAALLRVARAVADKTPVDWDHEVVSYPSLRPQILRLRALEGLAALHSSAVPDPLIGRSLSHYRVLERVGAGGMGVVYKAEDLRLRRPVALKVLPPEVTGDARSRTRFLREARAAAAVTHPHIATIYEVGEENGVLFIAMELIEGRTLRSHLAEGRLPVGEAVRLGIEIAEALGRAHHAGIVHRDLKPANVILQPDRHVKILDFGLARWEPGSSGGAIGSSEITATGRILGTPSYMSPEQARGQAVDARSDLFSFGIVLFEMVTGSTPFRGDTPTDMLSAIIRDQPPPAAEINPDVPAELQRIIGECLEKDPEERYQHADQLVVHLRKLRRTTSSDEQAVGPAGAASRGADALRGRRSWLGGRPLRIAGLAAAGAAALFALLYGFNPGGWRDRLSGARAGPSAGAPPAVSVAQLTREPGVETQPTLSPDGKLVAYSSNAAGNHDIYLLRVSGSNPINLTADSPVDDVAPAFSPDGARIAFRSEREGGGIFIMGATGESVTRLTDFGYDPAWSPDGAKVACATEGTVDDPASRDGLSQLWVVDVTSGSRKRLQVGPDAVQPAWSPHGRRIAYWANQGGQRDIWTTGADGERPTKVTDDPAIDWSPVWAPDGAYLYFSSDRGGSMNLWRVPIREETGEALGPPAPVTVPAAYAGPLNLSRDGRRLVYVELKDTENIHSIAFDPAKEIVVGQPAAVTRGSRLFGAPEVSPDGASLVSWSHGKQEDLFIVRQDGTGLRQITDDPYKDRWPRWSPDGKRIVFISNRSGFWEIWSIASSGGELRQLTDGRNDSFRQPLWSPDGSRIAYHHWEANKAEPRLLDPAVAWKDQTPQPLPHFGGPDEYVAPHSWSRDGTQLACALGRTRGVSGGIVTYSFTSRKYTQVIDSGAYPVWLHDGRRILYVDRGKILLVDVRSRQPREIFSVPGQDVGELSLSPDDRRIYFNLYSAESDLWLATLE